MQPSGGSILTTLGVRTARFPRRLRGERLSLRLRSPADLWRLPPLTTPEFMKAVSARPLRSPSALSFWLRVRRTYPVCYVIERPEESMPLGFLGLYDIRPGESLFFSMGFFRPGDRRRGFGREALSILLGHVGSRGIVRTVRAEMPPDKHDSIALLRSMGFRKAAEEGGKVVMERGPLSGR
ncbi:MAG: GNAT family N-acetyltransferase [Nitrospirota bacterium]|jgi:RimJ/RimL family protein N-acetyltransferase